MDSQPKVNRAIQGLDVFVEIDGKPVRAIIPRLVFEKSLNSRLGPSGWSQSYHVHQRVIDSLIRTRYAAKAQDFVVLRTSDFSTSAHELP